MSTRPRSALRQGARRNGARGLLVAASLVLVTGVVTTAVAGPAGAATTLAPINGQGSTYAALAFQQWTQTVQTKGLSVNYTATSSPSGLEAYDNNTATFAGTEAEYTSLFAGQGDQTVQRGYAYTPDVAGATAIMYHVDLNAGDPATGTPPSDPVNYLHLSRLTVAKIFLGIITNWDSPTISADNKGLVLPNHPIDVIGRSGQSGTTALFYDFVKQTDPTDFAAWATANGFNQTARILEVDNGLALTDQTWHFLGGSDQQASYVAGTQGLWSISYDEFGYAKVYDDNVAWIENAAGTWVQPYAKNIAAALKSAVLAPTTAQTLDQVYTSTTPAAYPISAYSYILFQCGPTPDRATCKSPYPNQGVIDTMAKFMRYIACTGQITMASIGYSPLPPQLSQFLANAIGWVTGQPPETLSASNCANPQFQGGTLGTGSTPPKDPTLGVSSEGPGPGGGGSTTTTSPGGSGVTTTTGPAGSGGGTTTTSGGTGSSGKGATGTTGSGGATTTTAGEAAAVGKVGSGTASAGGGSSTWLNPQPAAYTGPISPGGSPWPFVVLLLVILIPLALLTVGYRRRRAGAADVGPSDDQGATPA